MLDDGVGGGSGKSEKSKRIGFLVLGSTVEKMIEKESDKLAEKKLILRDVIPYLATVMTLPFTFEMTKYIFGESYNSIVPGKKLNIEYAFAGRGAVDQRRMNLAMEVLNELDSENPTKKTEILNTDDLDWTIITNHKLEDTGTKLLSNELKRRAFPMPAALSDYNKGFHHDFDPRSTAYINDFEDMLVLFNEYTPREKLDHVKDIPCNSVLVYEGKPLSEKTAEKKRRIDENLKRIKTFTGNYRTVDEYMKDWNKLVNEARKRFNMEPFIESYLQECPEAAKYFKQQ